MYKKKDVFSRVPENLGKQNEDLILCQGNISHVHKKYNLHRGVGTFFKIGCLAKIGNDWYKIFSISVLHDSINF